ncbi:carbohydrate ABC transporter permease [Deinococcus yavapaiensis]|uniref:Carbohydrate ABC transporter membrane protein 1 (CUT1 family) n=1 Tax=Deinococcus yavapaiensis KR-236 TaxID=694435 RepID=A0A318SPD2_9DEIO|nr:sugar ABC transporter permease [Deinococcus yavapaiensis]PYE54610.1 carbohydrate ABC transporter membrane protein 1 (CUT1 family) [Deinococcus yavapaiensis KR-236]
MAGMSTLRRREAINGYLFILPWLLGFLLFTAGPMLFSLYASFTNYDVTTRMRWIGLENYQRLLFDDSLFWTSLGNTGFYALFSVPLSVAVGLLIAVLLNQKVPGQRVFRTIFFLPKVLSGVAVLLLWLWVFNPEFGPINSFLRFIGIQNPPLWFSDPIWAKPALVIMSMWGAAGGFIIYLASLQGIPKDLYEAAMIDGAKPITQFWKITVPMMSPTIFFKLITGVYAALQFWEAALIVSSGGTGGPSYSTLFYGLYMWQKAFGEYQMGYASAMAWILLIIALTVTFIQFIGAKRWVHYEGEASR